MWGDGGQDGNGSIRGRSVRTASEVRKLALDGDDCCLVHQLIGEELIDEEFSLREHRLDVCRGALRDVSHGIAQQALVGGLAKVCLANRPTGADHLHVGDGVGKCDHGERQVDDGHQLGLWGGGIDVAVADCGHGDDGPVEGVCAAAPATAAQP